MTMIGAGLRPCIEWSPRRRRARSRSRRSPSATAVPEHAAGGPEQLGDERLAVAARRADRPLGRAGASPFGFRGDAGGNLDAPPGRPRPCACIERPAQRAWPATSPCLSSVRRAVRLLPQAENNVGTSARSTTRRTAHMKSPAKGLRSGGRCRSRCPREGMASVGRDSRRAMRRKWYGFHGGAEPVRVWLRPADVGAGARAVGVRRDS